MNPAREILAILIALLGLLLFAWGLMELGAPMLRILLGGALAYVGFLLARYTPVLTPGEDDDGRMEMRPREPDER